MTEEMIADIRNYRESKLLAPHEKAAIHFAEVLAGDHLSANQELFDELREHFTEPEIIDLGFRLMVYTGYTRFVRVLGIEDFGGSCIVSASERAAVQPSPAAK